VFQQRTPIITTIDFDACFNKEKSKHPMFIHPIQTFSDLENLTGNAANVKQLSSVS